MNGVDYIFHLAALTSVPDSHNLPRLYDGNNMSSLISVLQVARSNPSCRVIFTSSAAVYDKASPYALTKISGENYCSYYRATYNIPITVLRLFNVYGRNHSSGVVMRFIQSAKTGVRPVIYGDGSNTRDYVYIEDVVDACLWAMDNTPGDYDIGTGIPTSVLYLWKLISKLSSAPNDLFPRYLDSQVESRSSVADTKPASKQGFKTKWELAAGISDIVQCVSSGVR
jgi:UDP-glucose 4-epimerase